MHIKRIAHSRLVIPALVAIGLLLAGISYSLENQDIAKQSIFIGIGLSLFLMVLAALGYIQPVFGAMLQEIIDVVVILNALRVLFVRCDLASA